MYIQTYIIYNIYIQQSYRNLSAWARDAWLYIAGNKEPKSAQ